MENQKNTKIQNIQLKFFTFELNARPGNVKEEKEKGQKHLSKPNKLHKRKFYLMPGLSNTRLP